MRTPRRAPRSSQMPSTLHTLHGYKQRKSAPGFKHVQLHEALSSAYLGTHANAWDQRELCPEMPNTDIKAWRTSHRDRNVGAEDDGVAHGDALVPAAALAISKPAAKASSTDTSACKCLPLQNTGTSALAKQHGFCPCRSYADKEHIDLCTAM